MENTTVTRRSLLGGASAAAAVAVLPTLPLSEEAEVVHRYEVTVGHITPKEVWTTRKEWQQVLKESQERWKRLSAVEQNQMAEQVKHRIARLLETVDSWLEDGLTGGEVGDFMDVSFRLLFTDIRG